MPLHWDRGLRTEAFGTLPAAFLLPLAGQRPDPNVSVATTGKAVQTQLNPWSAGQQATVRSVTPPRCPSSLPTPVTRGNTPPFPATQPRAVPVLPKEVLGTQISQQGPCPAAGLTGSAFGFDFSTHSTLRAERRTAAVTPATRFFQTALAYLRHQDCASGHLTDSGVSFG